MKKRCILIITAALIAQTLCGCGKNAVNSGAEGKLITSQQAASDYYDIKLDYQGVVKSKETKNYAFLSGGKLEKVYAKEGQFVHKGDVLAQLDAVELKNGAAQSANNSAISSNNLNKTEATYLTNITNAEINMRTIDTSLAAIDSSVAAGKQGVTAADSNIAAFKENIAATEKGMKDYENSIPVAEKGVAALEKTISTDGEQIAAMQENIDAYKSKLESTRQAVDLAGTNLERMRTLYEKGAVPRSEVENMEVQYNDAESSYKQAEAQMSNYKVNLSQLTAAHEANLANLAGKKQELESMTTKLDANKAQVSSLYAQLDSLSSQRAQAAAQLDSLSSQRAQVAAQRETAQKELANLKKSMTNDVNSQKAAETIAKLAEEQAQRAVDNATLRADADGYIMAVNLKEGEMTGAGTPVVMVKSDTMVVSVGVSLEDYTALENILDIKINGEIEGHIDNIAQYPDEKTRTYKVDITFDSTDLAMGEIVDVELVTARTGGVFIPISSVVNIDGIDYVYKVNNDDTVSRMQVELGEVRDSTVHAKNLTNERIVTSGMKSLNDNDKVKEAEKPTEKADTTAEPKADDEVKADDK